LGPMRRETGASGAAHRDFGKTNRDHGYGEASGTYEPL
jgi:hypothetical protein